MGSGSFQWCPLTPMSLNRGNEHKLEHEKFHTNMRKDLFTVGVTEPWNRLPRGLWTPLFWR